MNSQTEEIKARLDVAEVVRQYVKIEKAGINLRGLCPFHKEKTPSFFVSPERQTWKCFGCGKGGDIFTFIEEIEGVEFREALRTLAHRAGVQLKHEDPKKRDERARLFEAQEAATAFFESQLSRKEADFIRKYLESRGITPESIKNFRIGYAPIAGTLAPHLKGQGFTDKELIGAGLALRSQRNANEIYDRFRGRIMFPISNIQGQVIAFGGRITEEESKRFKEKDMTPAKYVNSPETPIYNKSSVLYGLDKAKIEARKQDACIVTEGYTDVIMAHQAGHTNVVASSGTALTDRHLDLIQRYTNNLYIAFDMDVAGDTATKRGIDIAQEKGYNIKVITLSQGKDPADIIRENPEEWTKSIQNAKSIVEFYFDNTLDRFDASIPEEKAAIGRVVLPVILRIPSRIEKAHWVSRLAEVLHVDEQSVWQELSAVQIKNPSVSDTVQKATADQKPHDRVTQVKERILALLLKNPDLQPLLTEDTKAYLSIDTPLNAVLKRIADSKVEISEKECLQKASEEEQKLIDSVLFANEAYGDMDSQPKEELANLLWEWQKEGVRLRLRDVQFEIRNAEKTGDSKLNALVQEAHELVTKLSSFQ